MNFQSSNNFYQLYKPLKDLSSNYGIEDTIFHCWLLSEHINNNKPLPNTYFEFTQVLSTIKPFPSWELMIILKEVIMNSDGRTYGKKTIGNYSDFAKIINLVKKVSNDISEKHLNENSNVILALHRIPHQQFHWQSNLSRNTVLRYHKIYNSHNLETHIREKLGVNHLGLMVLLLLLTNHFLVHSTLNINSIPDTFVNNGENLFEYLKKITIDIDQVRTLLKANQKYDDSWEYTLNPFIQFPLVSMKSGSFDFVYCPFPQLLQKRFSEGFFFDIVDDSPNFTNAFGKAFQDYVGNVLTTVFSKNKFLVTAESEFMVGKNISHGIDWILSDETANLFIECKTKRLRSKGKVDLDSEELLSDIEKLSTAIYQTYKNINLAITGKSNWVYNNKPAFPMIITLEEWFLISPEIRQRIDEMVNVKLMKGGLRSELLMEMPYTISSINSFEIASRVIENNGVNKFMSMKVNEEYRNWDILNFSRMHFKANQISDDVIFPDELEIFTRRTYEFFNEKM